jgi:hypothetical protein
MRARVKMLEDMIEEGDHDKLLECEVHCARFYEIIAEPVKCPCNIEWYFVLHAVIKASADVM